VLYQIFFATLNESGCSNTRLDYWITGLLISNIFTLNFECDLISDESEYKLSNWYYTNAHTDLKY
jgi:hypothetical protein